MSAVPSVMLPLGTPLPAFSLPNTVDGHQVSSDAAGPHGALVMFICNHCPYVVHIRKVLVALANEATQRGLSVFAINSNSVQTHPQDGPANMKKLATEERWAFPFLFDESQAVAKRFHAACTPDLFLFDKEQKLVYRGQFDDSRPSNQVPVSGKDLKGAIDAVLAGQPVSPEQRASIGCNIKWHPG
ncbi:MAG: thioredoxin family protein [Myxococcaceae bacterium]|nr:thioredoxin family protein [Myxococcaceae bacterium]